MRGLQFKNDQALRPVIMGAHEDGSPRDTRGVRNPFGILGDLLGSVHCQDRQGYGLISILELQLYTKALQSGVLGAFTKSYCNKLLHFVIFKHPL